MAILHRCGIILKNITIMHKRKLNFQNYFENLLSKKTTKWLIRVFKKTFLRYN